MSRCRAIVFPQRASSDLPQQTVINHQASPTNTYPYPYYAGNRLYTPPAYDYSYFTRNTIPASPVDTVPASPMSIYSPSPVDTVPASPVSTTECFVNSLGVLMTPEEKRRTDELIAMIVYQFTIFHAIEQQARADLIDAEYSWWLQLLSGA